MVLFRVFFLAVLLLSCTNESGDKAVVSGKLPSKSTLRVGLESNPTNLDPRFATDAASSRIDQLIFSSLVKLDSNANPVGDLAVKWEIENEGKRYIFHLRKDVIFHDGTKLTSKDVKGTYLHVMNDASSSPYKKAYGDIIQTIETVDDYTVVFNLKKIHTPFIVDMVFPIIPASAGIDDKFPTTLIGSGPFKFDTFTSDEKVELSSFSNYYGGAPKVDKLIFRIITESNIRMLEIQKGTLDFLQNNITPDYLGLLEKKESLKVVRAAGTNYTYIGINMKDDITSKVEVRKALAYGIDRTIIVKAILKGQAKLANGLLSPSNWAYKNTKSYNYDPEKAKSLLDKAGYLDPDGDGPKARFELFFKTSQNEQANLIAEVMQAQLKKIGINLKINRYEWGTFYEFIKKGNFQIYTLTWVGITEPDMYYNTFHSESVPPNGANRGRFSNKVVDGLLEDARVAADSEKRKEKYAKVQQIVADELPYISLWHPVNIAIMKKEVKNFKLYPSGSLISFKDITFDAATH